MLSDRKKAEQMLSSHESIYARAYNDWPTFPVKTPRYEVKPKQIVTKQHIKKDICTLSPWRSEVPMSLFHRPKEIVRTHPNDVVQSFTKVPDADLEEVRRTRPRLVMHAIVSLDDVKDPKAREVLIKDTYTSVTSRDYGEVALRESSRANAPLPPLPVRANPVQFSTCFPPYVSPEWRRETVLWDKQQFRGHCDNTKKFWLDRPDPKCTACDQLAAGRARRRARLLF